MKLIYFHRGYQEYLALGVHQASLFNEVILIGDDSNKQLANIPNVTFFHYKDVNEHFDSFLKKYIHLSSNAAEYETLCFLRWIAARNVCNLLDLDNFAFTDSDNLFYSNLGEIHKKIGSPNLALAIPEHQPEHRNAATGEVSYWSKDHINSFCDFLINVYSDKDRINKLLMPKWNWHENNSKPGGINDMTLLWFFSRNYKHEITTRVHSNEFTFDHNINTSENFYKSEYEVTEQGIKKIHMIDRMPHCFNLRLNKKILFHSLQFQGAAKAFMHKFTIS